MKLKAMIVTFLLTITLVGCSSNQPVEVVDVAPENAVAITTELFDASNVGVLLDNVDLSKSPVESIYQVYDKSTVKGYLYRVNTTGMFDQMIFDIAINAAGDTILGFELISEQETEDIGHLLLIDPLFVEQFNNLSISSFKTSGVDFTSGSTAAKTLAGVNDGVMSVIEIHELNVA